MAYIVLGRRAPLPAAQAWRLVTDWDRHAAAVPLTRVIRSGGPASGPGARFTARTGLGRLGFDDPMEITVWQPPSGSGSPGRCRLEKRGRWVRGWAEIEVYEDGPASSRVVWREDLRPWGMPRFLDPVLARVARPVFGRALDAMLVVPDGP